MNDKELKERLAHLERENKMLRSASQQWGRLQQLYKESQKKLKTAEATTRSIIQSSPIGISITNANGFSEYLNPAFCRMMGYEADELLNKNILDFLADKDNGDACDYFTEFAGNQENSSIEALFFNKNGDILHFFVVSTIIVNEKLGKRKVNFFVDMTERNKLMEQLTLAKDTAIKANEAKSTFLANMSHEIRTPMNGVMGMAEILKQTDLSKEQHEYVNIINISANSLLNIINDILDFSKIEAGKIDLEDIPMRIDAVIEDIADLLVVKARDKGLDLITYIDSNIPESLIGDPVRLRQIILNFTNNALKFTEKGEVLISAHLAAKENERVKIIFKIKDTGIGISEEGKSRLFQNFSQVDSSTTRKYGGTGLGLVISKKLSEQMGGNVFVESEEGVGSVFGFTAWLKQDADPGLNNQGLSNTLPSLHVLVVDDNHTNLKIFGKYLQYWNCSSEFADMPVKGLEMLRAASVIGKKFDIVLVDFQMPEMDGMQFAKEVKSDHAIKHNNLILLSSITDLLKKDVIEKAGFSAYLNKPVKISQLKEAVQKTLGRTGASHGQDKKMLLRREINIKPKKKWKILLAEDNKINQKVALFAFKKLGFEADLAENGLEVLEKMKQKEYDIIFMDVQMPKMDGIEATIRIRQSEREGEHIPIVAMTANAMNEDRDDCLAAGMDSFMSKPFKPDDLKEIMSDLLIK